MKNFAQALAIIRCLLTLSLDGAEERFRVGPLLLLFTKGTISNFSNFILVMQQVVCE